MDLRYIVKNFNPTPRKQKVDVVPVVKKEEIEVIRQDINRVADMLAEQQEELPRIRYLMDMLADKQAEMAPDYVAACDLDEEQILKVRKYLLKVWEEYFPGYELSKDMNQLFVWNIPKYIYKAADLCAVKEYPDVLNPLFWFIMYCIDFKDPDDYCRIILTIIENALNDPEVSLMADKLLDERSSENNNEGED